MDATGKAYEIVKESNSNLLSLRPEQLSVDQFAELTNLIASSVGSDS